MYDEDYFERSNYRSYTKGWYRLWHWVKYLWVGMWLKAVGAKEVLDLGCADGVSVAAMRALGIRAWGCDVSEYVIAKAPKMARNYLWVGTVFERKERSGYDWVVTWDVLEHLCEKEAMRTLKYLGKIAKYGLLGVYVTDELISRIHRTTGKEHPDHLCERTGKWWESKMNKLGYKYYRLPMSRRGMWVVRFGDKRDK